MCVKAPYHTPSGHLHHHQNQVHTLQGVPGKCYNIQTYGEFFISSLNKKQIFYTFFLDIPASRPLSMPEVKGAPNIMGERGLMASESRRSICRHLLGVGTNITLEGVALSTRPHQACLPIWEQPRRFFSQFSSFSFSKPNSGCGKIKIGNSTYFKLR